MLLPQSRNKCFVYLAATALIIAFLWVGADAAAIDPSLNVPKGNENSARGDETTHTIVKRSYRDKGYGDGSLKKFFFMLKIVLATFGKY